MTGLGQVSGRGRVDRPVTARENASSDTRWVRDAPASSATPERVSRLQKQEPAWIQLWSVAVWGLLVVEYIWGGSPDRPEGVSWLEARGPLIPVGASVLALVVSAAVQARWSRTRAWESAGVGRLGLGSCPAWFEYTALGLGIVGSVLYAYAAFRSLGSGGDASVHALQRRAAMLLLIGSSSFLELISWLSYRRRKEAEARTDDVHEALGERESRRELAPFRRGLAIALAALPLGAFIALALAGGRGGALTVALAGLAILFAAAQFLAWWNRGVRDAQLGSAVLPSLQSCPPSFSYLVLGLTVLLSMYFLYGAVLAPYEHTGDSPHAVVRLAPLAVFLFGALCLLLLLPPMRSLRLRRRRDGLA